MTSALPSDPALPGLDRLCDPRGLTEYFRSCIRPEHRNHHHIESCNLIRFRYRPGKRAIALYDVGTRDETTDQVSTQWLTAMTYADKSVRQLFKKLHVELANGEQHNDCSAFQSLSYLADDDLLVQVFPVDRYLPQIGDFLKDPPTDVIAGMLGTFGPGNWTVKNIDIEPGRYRPLMGLTLRYCVEAYSKSGGRQTRNFFVKLYRGNEGSVTWQRLIELRRQLSGYSCTFELLHSGTWLEHHSALILEQAPGQPLDTILAGGGKDIDQVMTRVANAMFELHASPLKMPTVHLADELWGHADRSIEFISWARPEFANVLKGIRAALSDSQHVVEPRPAHCDLKAEHLLIDDCHVTFIDLDSAAMADPVYDLAMMLVRLQVMSTLDGLSRVVTEAAADSLLEHYFRLAPADWRNRLPHQLGNAGIKVALFFVQHQVPDWPKRTHLLLDQIYAVLKGTTTCIPGKSIP